MVLDLWEHLEICKEGQMSWLSRQIDEAHFIITVCSRGLKHYVEVLSHRCLAGSMTSCTLLLLLFID